jgi:hypothetical protein
LIIHCWIHDDYDVLETHFPTAPASASLRRGRGRLKIFKAPHRFFHLSPLSPDEGVREERFERPKKNQNFIFIIGYMAILMRKKRNSRMFIRLLGTPDHVPLTRGTRAGLFVSFRINFQLYITGIAYLRIVKAFPAGWPFAKLISHLRYTKGQAGARSPLHAGSSRNMSTGYFLYAPPHLRFVMTMVLPGGRWPRGSIFSYKKINVEEKYYMDKIDKK